MKKLFYTLIFIIFSLPFSAAQSSDDVCRQLMRPAKVKIDVSYGKLRYDFTKNYRSLTRLHIRQYGNNIATGKKVTGMAANDLIWTMNLHLQKNSLPDNTSCIYPTDVNLILNIKNPTIYIAKELEEGSCRYNIAMRHEQTHQQINIQVLEHYLPLIKNRLIEVIKNNSLISQPYDVNLSLAQETFKRKYLAAIQPLLDEMQAEITAEQAKLDSPENYEYEESLCL